MTRIETERARAWRRWNHLNLIALAQIYRPPEPEPEPEAERPKGRKWRGLERNRRRVVG